MITCEFESGHPASLRHVTVHAIVERQGKILLVRRAEWMLEGGKWGMPGGFLDRGENAAEGALRELYEETGWEGRIIDLFRVNTNPDRPAEDRQNIALEFLVEPVKQTGTPDTHESTRVEWVGLDSKKRLGDMAFDHEETIALYRQYRTTRFPLPRWQ